MQKEGASVQNHMWSFMWLDSSTQMEIFPQMEIIDCESLKNFPKTCAMDFVLIKL